MDKVKGMAFFIVGLLLVICLFGTTGLQEVLESISNIDTGVLAGTLVLQLVTLALINLQWWHIAFQVRPRVPLVGIMAINLTGTFVESLTPALKTGGEAVKVLLFRSRLGFSLMEALAVVGLQKTVSIGSFFFLNLVALLWFAGRLKSGPLFTLLLIGFTSLFLAALLLLAIVLFPNKLEQLALRTSWGLRQRGRVQTGFRSYQQVVGKALAHRGQLVYQLALSFLIWGLFPIKTYILAQALGLNLGIMPLALVTYLTYMVAMVPLAPGGLGTYEGSMVALLGVLGVSPHQGLALALVVRFVTFWFVFFLSALWLGAAFLAGRFRVTVQLPRS